MPATTDVLTYPLAKEAFNTDTSLKANKPLFTALSALSPVSLQEMKNVKLMNRVDSKYLVPVSFLPKFIKDLSSTYCIQEIDGIRIAKYKTLYLDTEELKFFLDHVNGKLNHMKLRIRNYVESDISFLEIKKKSNTGRTDKNRIHFETENGLIVDKYWEFIALKSGYSAENLKPMLHNSFNRITLVNKNMTERLTIDLNISFTNCRSGKSFMVSNLAIVELKQDKADHSIAGGYFTNMRIKRSGLSKYCLGLVLTSEQIKGNIYKQKIRHITKISNQA